MQQQKPSAEESYELTASNAEEASKLIREGKARLEIVVYPWGVDFAVSRAPAVVCRVAERKSNAV